MSITALIKKYSVSFSGHEGVAVPDHLHAQVGLSIIDRKVFYFRFRSCCVAMHDKLYAQVEPNIINKKQCSVSVSGYEV